MLQPAVSAAPAALVTVGQRIQAIDPDTGKQRLGTVEEVHPATRYARVRFDLKWMHDWLPLDALSSAPVAGRLPLGTIVRRFDGTEAVITGHNPNDVQRYRLSWFDRHFWIVRHRWTGKEAFEVIAQKQTAAPAA